MIDTIAELFHRGGYFVMSSITFVLFISLLIIFERFIRYWFIYDLSNTNAFMAGIQKAVMNNSIENAIRVCKELRPKLVPYVLAEGLKRADDSKNEIENAVEAASLKVIPLVSKWTAFLGTTANVATLLGLLGTIFGLMKSFAAAAERSGAEKQTVLAEGIAEALTATSYGLGTALLCLLAFGLLSIKQNSIIDNINLNSAKLIDLLYTRNLKTKSR